MIANDSRTISPSLGAIAQLGEHLHGMQGVGGSIPPSSTSYCGTDNLVK